MHEALTTVASRPFSGLVDKRFGLIRQVRMLPKRDDLPPSLYRAQAEVSRSDRISAWSCDDRSAGFAWDTPHSAWGAAAGEAVERYCGNLIPDGLRRASSEELTRAGEAAVAPDRLALFSDRQYKSPGFPFQPFTPDLRVLWTTGRRLVDDSPTWVPASLVWVTFSTGEPTRQEPKVHAIPYAGIATGLARRQAETTALLELLERDAVSLSWHRGDPLPRVEVPAWLRAKVETPAIGLDFYWFPSDFEVPVLGALAHDRSRDLVALGLACRAEPIPAALKAAAEALQLILTSRILDDPESPYMRQVAAGAPGLGVKPWQRDRSYRRLYHASWRDVWDLLCQLQLYQDPEMRQVLDERFSAAGTLPIEAIPALGPRLTGEEVRRQIIHRLAAGGHPPISIDVTTPDVAAATDLAVVRVIAPGLYGNAPAAFPYLGGPRLAAARKTESLYPWPLPYA